MVACYRAANAAVEADAFLSELEGRVAHFICLVSFMRGSLTSIAIYGQNPQLPDCHVQCALSGNAEDKAKEEERKKRAFNQVTEAASELMELGYEDIYTDTRETIQASAKG